MKFIFAIFLTLTLVTTMAQATEVLWLSFRTTYSYRDLSNVCSTPTTLYLGAEVVGLEIKKAIFKDSLNSSSASQIVLTADEIKGFELDKDKKGHLLLKTATMKSRLLTWMFFEAGGTSLSPCRPTQLIASIDPASFTYQFDVESPSEGAESNLGKFKGKLKDGAAYEVELQFSQRPYPSDEISEFDSLLTEIESDDTGRGSPVFSDKQDCRAIILKNPGLCRNRDCRGVLYHSQYYCQTNDCRAIVLGAVGYCQTRDCRAAIFNNIGYCESSNCRAVIYKNYGMCR